MIPVSDSPPALEPHAPEVEAPPRSTRKPMFFWDRVKFVVLFVGTWWVVVWADMADNPLLGWRDAVRLAWSAKWWLELLVVVEVVRQLHYLVSEHWSRYH